MVFKHFRTLCVIRVLLLAATLYLFIYLALNTILFASMIIVGGAAIYQLYSLIVFVEKTNKDLSRFLLAVKHSDFSQSFTVSGLGASFDKLRDAFMEVVDEFRKTRSEKEENFRYLQTVVKHVGIGLVAFKNNGDVELVNNPVKRLLKKNTIRNISELRDYSEELVDTLRDLKGGQKALVKVAKDDQLLQLAVYASQFKLRDQEYTLVSLQNIQYELEEKEMEAWQNLIRVLTHEIMNSITPISSLASTVNGLIKDSDSSKNLSDETLNDVRGALETIETRSNGLLEFVNAYRNLTKVPAPDFQIFVIADLFENVVSLLRPQFEEKSISFEMSVQPNGLELTADAKQVEQVLINLLVNAMHAVDDVKSPEIKLTASMDTMSRIRINVADNGKGILKEVQEKIFIPFFTTKQSGSGIGLSLCRQIMRLHRGTISVASIPNAGTVFTLRF